MKKTKPSDKQRLEQILDAIEFIEKATIDADFDKFEADFILHTAVIKWIEIIGEACCHLDRKLKSSHVEIEWRKIEGMRHVLVHEYFGIDIQMVWNVVENFIPQLKKDIENILKAFE
jgi:uncharacterized protein with HEPN domain